MREQLERDSKEVIRQVQEEAAEKSRNERDKSDQFIKEFVHSFSTGNEAENESLKQ